MRKIKAILRRKRGFWLNGALVLSALFLIGLIAWRAGKFPETFQPGALRSQEDEKEYSPPASYGTKEEKQKKGGADELAAAEKKGEQIKSIQGAKGEDSKAAEERPKKDAADEREKIIGKNRRLDEQIGKNSKGVDKKTEQNEKDPADPEKEEPPDSGDGTGGPDGEGNDNTGEDEKPSKPETGIEEEEDGVIWVAEDISVSYYGERDEVSFFKETIPSESYVRGNVTVTSHWYEKGNKENKRTKRETDYTLEPVPEKYNHKLTEADAGEVFSLTVNCCGLEEEIGCEIQNDSVEFTKLRVTYEETPTYVTGDVLFKEGETNEDPIKEAISLDVYGHARDGGEKVYFPEQTNYNIQFEESTGGVASKKADGGSYWGADILYCGAGGDSSVVLEQADAVNYRVMDYKLTVMYDDDNVLDTIYTDDSTIKLDNTYDGRCPYEEMIEELRRDGQYDVTEDGYLTHLFYGWSSVYPATARKGTITYTFKENQHKQTMYAVPTEPVLEEGYLVQKEEAVQALVGYVPEKRSKELKIPYGVTDIEMDESFQTSEQAEAVKTMVLSPTVEELDLSASGEKFPNLEEYSVVSGEGGEDGSDNFEISPYFSEYKGVLYTFDSETLLKVPAACYTFSVKSLTKLIAKNAFADVARSAEANDETLSITMLSKTPPEFEQAETAPVFGGASCSVRIAVPDSSGGTQIDDVVYLRYLSAWTDILEKELSENGTGADVLTTANGAQNRYQYEGDYICSMAGGKKALKYVTEKAKGALTVGDDIEIISSYAFKENTKVETVRLPGSILKLEDGCFASDGGNLRKVKIARGGGSTQLGKKIFGDTVKKNTKIIVPLEEYHNYLKRWRWQLNKDYGLGAALRLLVGINDEETEAVANGIYYVRINGKWIPKGIWRKTPGER